MLQRVSSWREKNVITRFGVGILLKACDDHHSHVCKGWFAHVWQATSADRLLLHARERSLSLHSRGRSRERLGGTVVAWR